METKKVKLTQLVINEHNPRIQTDEKAQKTIDSLLVFPKMMEHRPIVCRTDMVILGGNMRTQALRTIANMSIDEITSRLLNLCSFKKKMEIDQESLIRFWAGWLESPFAYITIADSFSEDEEKEFIIKDNLSYGKWDFDILANEFDEHLLSEFGMDMTMFGVDMNLDEFFNPEEESGEKDATIKVVIPANEKESEADIREIIENLLKESYPNIKVK